MLYVIGLGLDSDSISEHGKAAAGKCGKIYLENYTVEFPYSLEKIQKIINKKILPADRDFIEDLKIVDEAKKGNIGLLIYGSPFTATTHISIIQECIRKKIKFETIFSSSILDAIPETGLQIYKFGKISSIPKWGGSFRPTSFAETIKQNGSINAHSLLLVDIGLSFNDALDELQESSKEHGIKIQKLIVCSRLGTRESKIAYGKIEELKEEAIKAPFCFIIPGKMHFVEEEMAERYAINKF